MNKDELESKIKAAFEGVRLDRGVSLLQAAAADDAITDKQYKFLSRQEITWNWTVIPAETLQEYCYWIGFLDEKGFRYYIPALMVNCLHEVSVIGSEIVYYLCPNRDSWDHYMERYSLLNQQQRSAIAHFLYWYPSLVEIRGTERKVCQEAVEIYWHQYL